MVKKTFDKNGRTLYKFAHSVAQGGNCYLHRTSNDSRIENKEGLRSALNAVAIKYKLIDPTVKVYDTLFFFFFHLPKTLAPLTLIGSIQKNISSFGEWDEDYLFTGVYDLTESYLREHLKKLRYEYDEG